MTKSKNHLGSFRIVIGLIVGIIIGALMKQFLNLDQVEWITTNITGAVGTLFLRSLFMVVVPLVFASLAVGVAKLGSVEHLGKLGSKLAVFYFCTTLIAVLIGQILVTTLKPGEGVERSFVESAQSTFAEQTNNLKEKSEGVNKSLWPGLVETVVPKNIFEDLAKGNMLGIIFIGLLLGAALLHLKTDSKHRLIDVLEAVSDVSIKVVGWIMHLAPYAVACLMINTVVQFDISIIGNVGAYFLVVVLGYLLHFSITYPLIVKYLVRLPLKVFYKRMTPIFSTSFSTSSSNATLPTTIQTLQKSFGVPEKITSFCAPLGATINMDGTALFEMVAAVFIAQVFGIDLSLTQHITLLFLVIITSVGVAGVPGGSIPLLMSAMATVGIPPEGIALILGVDRLLDMGRTVLNVTGDALASLYLSRVEKIPLEKYEPADQN